MGNYYSQYGQDEFLNKVIFNNKRKGFFIDIGAHDGVMINNTLFFEKHLDWDGVCIEPNPNVFRKLTQNRKAENLNVCIGNDNRTVKFTQIEGYSEMLSGITEKYDKRHVDRIKNEVATLGGNVQEIEVEMITLESVESIRDKMIDFISIDTEGNEYDIIKSINFNVLDIKSLVIENNYSDNQIANYLESFGFKKIYKLKGDEIFINEKNYSFGIKFRVQLWKLKVLMNKIMNKLFK
jgi:FkbM family methyltransferase